MKTLSSWQKKRPGWPWDSAQKIKVAIQIQKHSLVINKDGGWDPLSLYWHLLTSFGNSPKLDDAMVIRLTWWRHQLAETVSVVKTSSWGIPLSVEVKMIHSYQSYSWAIRVIVFKAVYANLVGTCRKSTILTGLFWVSTNIRFTVINEVMVRTYLHISSRWHLHVNNWFPPPTAGHAQNVTVGPHSISPILDQQLAFKEISESNNLSFYGFSGAHIYHISYISWSVDLLEYFVYWVHFTILAQPSMQLLDIEPFLQ